MIFEHFSVEMQSLLDDFSCSNINIEQLCEGYKAIGTEGHNIMAYKDLLEHARVAEVRLHGGFIPRTYARTVMREGRE